MFSLRSTTCCCCLRRPPPSFHHYLSSSRFFSAQQAAVALRPFYFAVHPDRFAKDPEAQNGNEKALQIFNGYLNDLFPHPSSTLRPVKLKFAIRSRDNHAQLREVYIQLYGADPMMIVRSALESCDLGTEHLPKVKPTLASPTYSHSAGPDDYPFASWTAEASDKVGRKRRRSPPNRPNDLFAALAKARGDALSKREQFERSSEFLADELEYATRKTGVKEIIWKINWDQAYMRRCLSNIQNMMRQADKDTRETLVHALYGKRLILGRGSHICADGSLQFGADDATGAWAKVCLESHLRRFEIWNLERLAERVRSLLGECHLLMNPYAHLQRTTQQMQAVIVRLSSQSKQEMDEMRALASNTIIEIVSAYGELALLKDGRLIIPCNINVPSLREFLLREGAQSRQIKANAERMKVELENEKDDCCKALQLNSISWDEVLGTETLIECLKRLRAITSEKKRMVMRDLSIHISSNPNIHVLSNGSLSIPPNWV